MTPRKIDPLHKFLESMIRTFPNEEDRINALEYTLIGTTTRWWGTHW